MVYRKSANDTGLYKNYKKQTRMKIIFASFFILTTNLLFCQIKKYESIIQEFVKKDNFNGTVLIASDGKTAFLHSYGIGDRQLKVPISNNSKFKICSITKTFVAVLLLQLYEEGKIKFTDSIGQYLDNYKGPAKNKVTIHQLLTYSSGIPNCEHGKGLEVYQKTISVDNFIDQYCSDSLEFTPGSRFNYDNGAYVVLGKIIEKITGKSFTEILTEKIINPLKLKHTGLLQDREIIEGLIPSYVYDKKNNNFKNDPAYFIENYFSSGAMYSTVEDLLKFNQGIFKGKIIKDETRKLMLKSYPELYGVAYGFWVTELTLGNIKTVGADRQGAIMGSNTTWLHLIPENKTVIIFSNTNATNINELRKLLAIELLKKTD